MSPKDFKRLGSAAMAFISQDAQKEQEEQNVQDELEEQEDREELPISKLSQGKKGKKLPRRNIAFSPQNYEYLTIVRGLEGVTCSEYINRLLIADRNARKDFIDQMQGLLKSRKMSDS